MTQMKSGSNLEHALARGEFVVTGELGPPKSADVETIRSKAKHLKGSVDAVSYLVAHSEWSTITQGSGHKKPLPLQDPGQPSDELPAGECTGGQRFEPLTHPSCVFDDRAE